MLAKILTKQLEPFCCHDDTIERSINIAPLINYQKTFIENLSKNYDDSIGLLRARAQTATMNKSDSTISWSQKRFIFYWNWSVVWALNFCKQRMYNLLLSMRNLRKWAQKQTISPKSGDAEKFKSVNCSARIEINFNNKRCYRQLQSNNIIKQRWWSVLAQKKKCFCLKFIFWYFDWFFFFFD